MTWFVAQKYQELSGVSFCGFHSITDTRGMTLPKILDSAPEWGVGTLHHGSLRPHRVSQAFYLCDSASSFLHVFFRVNYGRKITLPSISTVGHRKASNQIGSTQEQERLVLERLVFLGVLVHGSSLRAWVWPRLSAWNAIFKMIFLKRDFLLLQDQESM